MSPEHLGIDEMMCSGGTARVAESSRRADPSATRRGQRSQASPARALDHNEGKYRNEVRKVNAGKGDAALDEVGTSLLRLSTKR